MILIVLISPATYPSTALSITVPINSKIQPANIKKLRAILNIIAVFLFLFS